MKKEKLIYFDNQASTPLDKRVANCMKPHLSTLFGNAHSNDHYIGWNSKKEIDIARERVANFLKTNASEIFFTSGATEANNLAIIGLWPFLKQSEKNKIIISTIEHKCILESAKELVKYGAEVVFLPAKRNGLVSPEELEEVIDDTVGLVSIMTVNNEIGTIQPIKELSTIAHRVGAFFHTDAAQATIFMDLDITILDVDLLSISAHKMHGPQGIGCLYVKNTVQNAITPIIHGGGQERGIRSGTLPTMLCVGLGKICEIVNEERQKNAQHLRILSDLFFNRLQAEFPSVVLNGSPALRHPGNLNIQFPGFDAHSVIQSLQPWLAVSTGSACNSGTITSSYVLQAIGLNEEEAASSIRVSFGLQNTEKEVVTAVELLLNTLHSLQHNSC